MSLILETRASSSITRRRSMVCFVCEAIWRRDEGGYEVCAVDVPTSSRALGSTSKSMVLGEPLFHLPNTYPVTMNFFAFGSKIYFFGGCPPGHSRLLSKDVYVYDTSSPGIRKVGCMNLGKLGAVVIGPVNDKFYVMSQILTFRDFEVFDPNCNAWYYPTQPPVHHFPSPLNGPFKICAYAVVNNGREILLSTQSSGLFSYDTVERDWSHFPERSLPFQGGAVPIGGDRYLVFLERYQMVLGTYCYNSSNNGWYDFQCIWRGGNAITHRQIASPLWLGDGLVCGVLSGYNRSPYDLDLAAPSNLCIEMGFYRARAGQVKFLSFQRYRNKYDMKKFHRWMIASFPL
ncbi:uncharacterized protein LOC119991162 isoform X2 [Tripterygium wilfordii]|nr:uncharacterized protein LOC119991162 isoform X2 [Tripterygium wilfordii]